ncbi:MAG: hypothetical protein AAF531_10470 [Actinomycetota bacterium]
MRLAGPLPVPSAAYTITDPQMVWGWRPVGPAEPAVVGDVIVGRVLSVSAHTFYQDRTGWPADLYVGQVALFVFGNRYATDAYEAVVPDTIPTEVAMVSASGVVAEVRSANSALKTPTMIEVLGRAVDEDLQPISTLDQPVVRRRRGAKTEPRSKLILVVGTSMNAGKSTMATAATRALTMAGHTVKASKVTGTASLKEIFGPRSAGAVAINDFSFLGYPSTYLLPQDEVLGIFDTLDHAIANNPDNYWVVEIADGICQRETATLLASERVQDRIHRLVFCAREPLSVKGGVDTLSEVYGLAPDLIGGLVAAAPLGRAEIRQAGITTPVFNALDPDHAALAALLTGDDEGGGDR